MEVNMSRPHTMMSLTQRVSSANFPERQSKNPFFIRNNPHPNKVRHIKGLLDYPVCTVLDAGYNENHPIKSKNLQRRPKLGIGLKSEKFVPGIGIVCSQPQWMSELQSFTQKVGFKRNQPPVLYSRQVLTCKVNPDRSNHSKPPPSRCISTRQSERSVVSHVGQSRQNSRMRKAEDAFVRRSVTNNNEANKTKSSNEIETEALNGNLVHFEDNETYVFQLLSQILQTDSIDDVKHWLTQAPSKEKEVVLEMVRAISDSNLQFREQMDELRRVKEPEYESNILYHESSLDPFLLYKNKYDGDGSPINSPRHRTPGIKDSAKLLLDQINQNVDIEIEKNGKRSGSPVIDEHLLLPAITEEDAAVEKIRSRLMSRSSVNVFGRSSSK